MNAVEARGLRKTYHLGRQSVPVLHGIDLTIQRGDFVSIMGASGSGKSTLMNLIGLLDTPTSGGLRILGRDASRLSRNGRAQARRQALGFVFQAFNLMPRATALQNVMLPMSFAGVPVRHRKRRGMALLGSVDLADRADHRPNELSGGQKQRVAIARALALDPPILLADEPTGNLDSTTSAQTMDLFNRLHRSGRTIIQVTHDMDMARRGQRIIHLRDGLVQHTAVRGHA